MSLTFWQKKTADGWQAYWDTLNAPHRDAIVAALRTLPPFTSLLEVGAGPGVNLWRILEAFPDVDVTGLDVSEAAVEDGSRRFLEATRDGVLTGKGRVALCAGVLPEALEAMEPVDVVLSVYALAYLPPRAVQLAMAQLLRLAQQAIIIAEPMATPTLSQGPIVDRGFESRPLEFRYDYLHWAQGAGRRAQGWRVTSIKPLMVDRMNRLLVMERVTP